MGKRIEAMELELMLVSCVHKVWASLRVFRFGWDTEQPKDKMRLT